MSPADRAGGLLRPLAPPPRAALLAVAGLVALVCLPLLPALAGDRTLYVRDISMVWLPQAEALVRCWSEGAWPVWNPWSGFGRPLWADPRAGVLYPPTWLNLLLLPATFYGLYAAGHLAFSGVGMWLLARRFGASRAGAFAAGAVWVASGPLPSLVAMWHHLAGAAWIPWVVLAAESALDAPSFRRVGWWGAALALQFLAGSPDFSLITGGLVAVLVLWRAFSAGRVGARRVALRTGAAVCLGTLLSAAQWLPTLDVVSRASRQDQSAEGRTTWSLPPAVLLEVGVPVSWWRLPLTPRAAERLIDGRGPWLYSVYLGGAGLALLIAGAVRPHRRRWLLLLLLGLGVALALGRHSPLYELAATLPPVRLLRYPVKVMVAAAFAWSLLAGLGYDALVAADRRARLAAMVTLAAAGALCLAAALPLALFRFPEGLLEVTDAAVAAPGARRLALQCAAGAALAAIGVYALRQTPTRSRLAAALAPLMLCLAVGDLLLRHRDLNPTAPRALWQHRPELIEALALPPGGRLYAYDYTIDPELSPQRDWSVGDALAVARTPVGFDPQASLIFAVHSTLMPPAAGRWGVEGSYDLDILGFDPVPVDALARRLRLMEAEPAHARLLRLGAVSRVVALVPAPWWEDLQRIDERPGWFRRPTRTFAVPDALPRAWAVTGVRVAAGSTALELLGSPGFDPEREVILPGGRAVPGGSPAGVVRTLERVADRVGLEADLVAPGYVVMADAWDPGWRVRVDGTAAPLLRANVAFRAVAVPAGIHRIDLVYRPPALLGGVALTSLTLVAIAIGLALAARGRDARHLTPP